MDELVFVNENNETTLKITNNLRGTEDYPSMPVTFWEKLKAKSDGVGAK